MIKRAEIRKEYEVFFSYLTSKQYEAGYPKVALTITPEKYTDVTM